MDKNMTLEKRIAAELYCYQGKMSVFVDDLQGHTVEVGADEEFETAVKEFAKTGQDSDAVSGLIAYTSHNENEIYTLDYGNRFTSQILYRLGYKWPITDDRYLESAIEALDRLAFFD